MSLKKCLDCEKPLNTVNFYKLKRPTERYADGFLPICKKCANKNFKVNNPASFMPILRELDTPWIPTQYKEVCLKVPQSVSENNPAILGRYIARMKLQQFAVYDYISSLEAQARMDPKGLMTDDPLENYNQTARIGEPAFEAPHLDFGFSEITGKNNKPLIDPSGQIYENESLEGQLYKMEREEKKETVIEDNPLGIPTIENIEDNPLYDKRSGILLTKEEARWLIGKWGDYNISQLLRLERMYLEMMEDFDIRTSTHKDHLKKMCVCSLRMDELLAQGMFTEAKAASSMFESISKAANLQPIQDKGSVNNGEFVVGQLVKKCESEGFIPRFIADDEIPKDIVDRTILDQQLYLKRLVDNDGTIISRFEQEAVALLEAEHQKKMDLEFGEDYVDEDIFDEYNLLKEFEELEEIGKDGNTSTKQTK